MPEIRHQQPRQQGPPDPAIIRRAQHQRLVDGEEEIEVRELSEHDSGGGWERSGGGGGVGQGEVGVGLEEGEVGAEEGGEGLDVEEEEAVGEWDG